VFFRGAARDDAKKAYFFRRKLRAPFRDVFLLSTSNDALTSRDQDASSAENAPLQSLAAKRALRKTT
jgi:hypothetical protein